MSSTRFAVAVSASLACLMLGLMLGVLAGSGRAVHQLRMQTVTTTRAAPLQVGDRTVTVTAGGRSPQPAATRIRTVDAVARTVTETVTAPAETATVTVTAAAAAPATPPDPPGGAGKRHGKGHGKGHGKKPGPGGGPP